MKKLTIFTVLMLFLTATNAHAVIPVVDWANGIHSQIRDIIDQTRFVSEYVEYVKQTYYQVQQVQNQIQQIQQTAQMLQNVDASSLSSLYGSFNSSVNTLRTIDSNIVGLTHNYSDIENKFGDLYQTYERMKGNTSAQQKALINKVQAQIADANKNAMRAQAIQKQLQDSLDELTQLQSKNHSARGLLEATQIANEISIRNTREIIRLQEVMAKSMRAAASVQEAERVRADAAQIEAENFNRYVKPAKSKPVPIVHLQ